MDWLFELSNVTLENQSKWSVTLEQQYKPTSVTFEKKINQCKCTDALEQQYQHSSANGLIS